MIHQRMATTLIGLITISVALLLGCGARTDDHATDTKTNWLSSCDADAECDDGLSCLCGVCTVSCGVTAVCETFGRQAGCFHAECANGGGVCALPETPLDTSVDPSHDASVDTSTQVLPDGGSMADCPRSPEAYVAQGEECSGITLDCFPPWRSFGDSCGCGCELGPACDTDLTYVAYGAACDSTDYDCATTEERFRDECGCGCKPSEDSAECDPTVEYVAYGTECQVIDFVCDSGEQQVTDECGCGCKPSTMDCPRDEDAYALRGADCDNAAIDCAPGTSNFQDECGCGCEANPACDPDVEYLVFGTCEGIDFECAPSEVGVTDECGCGCTANPACDPDVEYVLYGGCDVALFACDDGEQMVVDECGCGCLPGSVDGGAAPTECAAPAGTSFATEVLFQATCFQDAYVHQVVASEEELQQALTQCGADVGSAPTYQGQPLYVATVAERTIAYHLYSVETDDGLHVGFEYPAYCEGARPPTLMFVLQIEGLEAESMVIEDVCNTGGCSGPPPP